MPRFGAPSRSGRWAGSFPLYLLRQLRALLLCPECELRVRRGGVRPHARVGVTRAREAVAAGGACVAQLGVSLEPVLSLVCVRHLTERERERE